MSRKIAPVNKINLSTDEKTACQGGKLLFTTWQNRQMALLIQDNQLKAVRFFPKKQSRIGAIYIAKVKNVVKNLEAYFVEIGGKEHEICFLSKKDAAHPFLLNRIYDGRILEGDEFPVQVTRDAQKTKQASVTTLLSISNDYFALSVGESRTGYSNKLSPADKNRLMQLLQTPEWEIPSVFLPKAPSNPLVQTALSVGLVVRTQAANVEDNRILLRHFQSLTDRWTELFQTATHRTCFSCLEEPPAPELAALDELAYPYEYEEILTDDCSIYNRLQTIPQLLTEKKLRLYDESRSKALSLSKLYALDSKMDIALNKRVWLKSGGYLIIEPTEALTVIDVNSGKYEAKKGIEETACHINKEAAAEIASQLRLRNLSGIILVDFINMKNKDYQKELLEDLKRFVNKDKIKTVVVDMTPLGLVEITRKKAYKTLAEQYQSQD